MCPTLWKIAGISLIVLGFGGSLPFGPDGPVDSRIIVVEPPDLKYARVNEDLFELIDVDVPDQSPLEDILKHVKARTGTSGLGALIYVDPEGLAEVGKTMRSPVSRPVPEGAERRTTLRQLLRPMGLDYQVQADGLLIVSSRSAILERKIVDLQQEVSKQREPVRSLDRSAGSSSTPPAASAKPGQGPGGDAEDARTKAIRAKLQVPISMSFSNETPLEDVLKYIKSATQGPTDAGIPIYVDPFALNEAKKTMTSPVTLDIEEVPLRITLQILLKQLGLTYMVRDGLLSIVRDDLLTIPSERSEAHQISILEAVEKAKQGELSLAEIRELTALIKAVDELDQASQKLFGAGRAGQ